MSIVGKTFFRLGYYLFTRVLKEGSDRRFNGVRDNPVKLLGFWIGQGMFLFSVCDGHDGSDRVTVNSPVSVYVVCSLKLYTLPPKAMFLAYNRLLSACKLYLTELPLELFALLIILCASITFEIMQRKISFPFQVCGL